MSPIVQKEANGNYVFFSIPRGCFMRYLKQEDRNVKLTDSGLVSVASTGIAAKKEVKFEYANQWYQIRPQNRHNPRTEMEIWGEQGLINNEYFDPQTERWIEIDA